MEKKRNELRTGVVLSYITLFVENIIPLFYTPWMLATMGQSEHGLYNLAHSIVGYLSLLSIGLGSAILKFLSDKVAVGDKDGENSLAGLFTIIYTIIGIIAFICGGFIAINAHSIFDKSLSSAELGRLRVLLWLSTINTAVTFPGTVYNSLIIAHQKFIFNKSLGLFFSILGPCMNVAVLMCGTGSVGLVAASTTLNIFSALIKLIYCLRVLRVRPKLENVDISPLMAIFKYSIFIFIGEISNMLYSSTDKMLLGAYCGTAIVSVYSIGASLQTYYCAFSTTISNVLFPKINALVAHDASDAELSEAFIKYGRIQYLLMCLITTGFILFGKQFIILFWGGKGYANAYYVALITMIPSLIPLIQNVGLNIVQAKSKHQFRTLCLFCIAVVNFIFSWLLVRRYGMIGCTIPTGVSYLLGQGVAMNWFYWKKMHLNIPAFWKTIGKMTIPVLPLFAISFFAIKMFGVNSRIRLFMGIVIYAICYLAIIWKFVANSYEKSLVSSKLRNISMRQ